LAASSPIQIEKENINSALHYTIVQRQIGVIQEGARKRRGKDKRRAKESKRY